MRRKIIVIMLVFVMIFPICFTTINLAYGATSTNEKDKVVSNKITNQKETEKTTNTNNTSKNNQTNKGETGKNDQVDSTNHKTDKNNTNATSQTNPTNNGTKTEVDSSKPVTTEKVPDDKKKETETEESKSKQIKQKEALEKQEEEATEAENDGIMSYALTNETSARLENGTYRIQSKLNQKMVFQVEGKSTHNGKKVKLANQLSVSTSQNVIVKYLNNGYYSLTFENSKKVLDVPGASKKLGTAIQQYKSNNSLAQQWILKADGNGYYSIISRCNGLYVDVPAGKAVKGANLQLYKGNNTDAQKFKFEKVEPVKSEKTIEEGLYYISSALSYHKVLTIDKGKTNNAANLQLGDKGKQYQKFQVSYDKNLKAYTIQAFHSDKVLDVAGAGQTNGTNVQQYKGNKSAAQQWIIQKTDDGFYYIISKCNYLFLDLNGASTKTGTNLQVYEPNGTKAQKFKFQKISKDTCDKVLNDGVYKISSALQGNKVFDIAGGSSSNGANLQLWNSENVQQQKFQITYNSNEKYYEIKAIHSNKALDVVGNGKTDGTNVWQHASNHSNAQKWVLKDAGNGYFYIVAVYSGLYLDVAGASTANGTNVQLYTGNGTKAQKFKFVKTTTIDSNNYQIVIGKSANKVLDISGGSYEENANLQIWDRENVNQQIFQVKAINHTDYKIIAKHSKKVLTVTSDNNVVQATDNNTNNQKWIFESIGNGYYKIKSKSTGRYLDIYGNGTANGTNVQVYKANNSTGQMFKLYQVFEKSGIDVSYFQNLINWNEVSKTGYSDFAMIRAGFRGYGATGTLNTDPQFINNIRGAKANGIPVGLYFFTQAVNTKEAVQEANYVLNLVQLAKTYGVNITYPIAIDTETANGGAGRADRLDVATRTAVCKAFCDTIRKAGYTPAIYASRDWFYNNLDMNQLKGYDIWVAHYTGSTSHKTDYKYNYDMWQYTSSGKVNGIVGNVDLNVSYKNY